MGDDSSGQSTLQTLASVFAGGLQGYVDSQNQQPVYVTAPSPQTAYGYAGQPSSATGATGAFTLSPVMLLVLAAGAFFLLKK
jgi:hypothetical protein